MFPFKYENCGGALPDGGKVFAINAESDVELAGGALARADATDFRLYELAGVSHIPASVLPLTAFGATRQNVAVASDFFRTAIINLHHWIDTNATPPPTAVLDGTMGALAAARLFEDRRTDAMLLPWTGDEYGATQAFAVAHDAAGNATGGIRLPHMATGTAGAPLGVYGGMEPNAAGTDTATNNVFVANGGTFRAFTAGELHTRYPTHAAYVTAVTAAAQAALDAKLILQSDFDQYVSDAKASTTGN